MLRKPGFYMGLFAGGMAIGALGWIANESTIAKDAQWGVPLIVIGVTGIVVGLAGAFINWWNTKK